MGPVVLPAMVNPGLWKPAQLMQRAIQGVSSPGIQKPYPVSIDLSNSPDALVSATQAWLISLISKELKMEPETLAIDIPFQEYGMDSIMLAQVITKMDRELKNVNFEPSAFLEYPTAKSLAGYMIQIYPEALASLLAMEIENGADLPGTDRRSPDAIAQFTSGKSESFPGKKRQ